jgi:hypothetical protein
LPSAPTEKFVLGRKVGKGNGHSGGGQPGKGGQH